MSILLNRDAGMGLFSAGGEQGGKRDPFTYEVPASPKLSSVSGPLHP
jgi:hypothetical protein